MLLSLGAKPAASFADPIGMMSDCHRRIERFLQMLVVIAKRQGGPLDAEHRNALDAALGYFRVGGPRHTEDEEVSLFPRLKASGGEFVAAHGMTMEALQADHRRAEQAHEQLDLLGVQWLDKGVLPPDGAGEFSRLVAELEATYRRHIATEDGELFPLANKVLTPESLRQIGEEMKKRRADVFSPRT